MKNDWNWCSMFKSKRLKIFGYTLLCTLLVFGVSSCKVVQKIDSLNGILEPPPPDPEVSQLRVAENAFFIGDYQLSSELFTTVRDNSAKDIYKNQALYGLACIQIITAENFEEIQKGFADLQQWQEPSAGFYGYVENMKMISEALNKKTDLFECEPEIRYITKNDKGKLLKKHQDEIKELKNTIKKLEHQISVLEAIDQEIQEKRKPI